MRTVVLLSILSLAAADSRLAEQGSCVVDGGEAVSDLMDSAMFIWAAMARCGHTGEKIKCEIGISSAIESVNSMINVILKAVDKCGDLNTENKDCAMAASTLTRATAGLSAAAGGIIQKCPNALNDRPHGNNWQHAQYAMCTVNMKNTAKSLFKTIKAFLKIKKKCADENSRACTSGALKIIAGFAGLGEYLAGTVGQCNHNFAKDALCAQAATMLVHKLTKVAQAGTELSKYCEGGAAPAPAPAPKARQHRVVIPVYQQVPRLYSKDDKTEDKTSVNFANLMLGAFLPVTAIVSFVGGRFYADRRSRMEQTREFLSDHE